MNQSHKRFFIGFVKQKFSAYQPILCLNGDKLRTELEPSYSYQINPNPNPNLGKLRFPTRFLTRKVGISFECCAA